ncbi:uncharacterized protein LOC120503681 isoform X1 [Passer montanus]|uniref:uncharacterized protein LOC120503681 isoform X1 n=1 Tax=Passer montanus TaxID=9160 RepID=UPI0019614F6B|nr:uncharacterized protein LOC120503681 isoform X1 [Passer montanus]
MRREQRGRAGRGRWGQGPRDGARAGPDPGRGRCGCSGKIRFGSPGRFRFRFSGKIRFWFSGSTGKVSVRVLRMGRFRLSGKIRFGLPGSSGKVRFGSTGRVRFRLSGKIRFGFSGSTGKVQFGPSWKIRFGFAGKVSVRVPRMGPLGLFRVRPGRGLGAGSGRAPHAPSLCPSLGFSLRLSGPGPSRSRFYPRPVPGPSRPHKDPGLRRLRAGPARGARGGSGGSFLSRARDGTISLSPFPSCPSATPPSSPPCHPRGPILCPQTGGRLTRLSPPGGGSGATNWAPLSRGLRLPLFCRFLTSGDFCHPWNRGNIPDVPGMSPARCQPRTPSLMSPGCRQCPGGGTQPCHPPCCHLQAGDTCDSRGCR